MLKNEVNKLFSDIKNDIVADANAKNKNLNNKIPKSLHWTITDTEDIIRGDFFGWEWITQAWETGRGRTINHTAGKITLQQKLIKWVEDRNLATGKKAIGLSWYISKKIHENGTKDFPTKTGILFDNITTNRVNRFFNQISKDIIKMYTIKNHERNKIK